jgi:hydroxymethylbilane synthase
VGAIDHPVTRHCVLAERALLAVLQADCHSPVAALATLDGDVLTIRAELFSEDGDAHVAGVGNDPAALAAELLARAPEAVRRLFEG